MTRRPISRPGANNVVLLEQRSANGASVAPPPSRAAQRGSRADIGAHRATGSRRRPRPQKGTEEPFMPAGFAGTTPTLEWIRGFLSSQRAAHPGAGPPHAAARAETPDPRVGPAELHITRLPCTHLVRVREGHHPREVVGFDSRSIDRGRRHTETRCCVGRRARRRPRTRRGDGNGREVLPIRGHTWPIPSWGRGQEHRGTPSGTEWNASWTWPRSLRTDSRPWTRCDDS